MGSLNIELRYTTCSRLLLWSSVLLLLLLSQRLRPMPRLMLLSFTEPTDMPVSHTPVMPDMPMELTHMLTTERDLLKLSQRLMLTMDTTDMPDLMPMVTDHMDTQLMVTTERDLLKLSQRLMPTTDTTDMPDLMPMVTDHTDTQLMVTTERDLLMLSQRLMLMLTMVSMVTHMPMVLTTERDLLMLSQRLTPTTDTMDMPDLMPMDMPHMLMVLMDVSGDKLNATQLRSSKANIKYQ